MAITIKWGKPRFVPHSELEPTVGPKGTSGGSDVSLGSGKSHDRLIQTATLRILLHEHRQAGGKVALADWLYDNGVRIHPDAR